MSQSNLNTNDSDNHTTERGVPVTRIRIDDLPVAENLTPEQEELIQGAGLKSFRPSLEALEVRDVPAVIGVGMDLTDRVLTISSSPPGSPQTNSATVRMNTSDQVVAQRGNGPAVFLDKSQVTRIVYEGGVGINDTFSNNTNIQSSFVGKEQGDVHFNDPRAFVVSADPAMAAAGFNLTSNFPNGLPQSAASGDTMVGGVRIGTNTPPPVTWRNVPPDTQSYALTMQDIDAKGNLARDGKFTHWVVYNIPGTTREIRVSEDGRMLEGFDRAGTKTFSIQRPEMPASSSTSFGPTQEGVDGAGNPGYNGANPPGRETHNYVFTLYALKTPTLQLPAGATAMTQQHLETAMQDQIVGQTSVRATFTYPEGTQSEWSPPTTN